tara:strand:+ start:16492 stop:16893 length:402 start_codon:yes stop_codon:yes gene_type:complete
MQAKTSDNKQLRNFGFILASGIMMLFGVLFPLLKQKPSSIWPWAIAIGLFLIAFLLPKALKLIYTPWMKLGEILGWVNTRIILGFIFFFIMTPIGFVLKCVKHDPLNRTLDNNIPTYKIKSENQKIEHMERPY